MTADRITAERALDEVERRLRDTEWSSEASDRCRIALLHIEAYRRENPTIEERVRARVEAAVDAAWNEGHRSGWEHHLDGSYGTDYWDDPTPSPYATREETHEADPPDARIAEHGKQ